MLPLFLSLFISIVTLLIGPFLNLNLISIILLSGGLSFSDYIRSKILTGFPWNLWAYSFSSSIEIIQILNKIGLFAFNLISITIFMLPAILLVKTETFKKLISMTFMIIIIFFLYLW